MKRSTVAVLTLIAAVLGVAGWFAFGRSGKAAPTSAPPPVATVRTAAMGTAVLARRITAFGDVTSGQVVGASFPRAGQVTRLPVMPGRRVARGTVLATLTPDPAVLESYQQAVTAADLALREWKRQQELLKLQLATQSQVGAAEKGYRDAAGNVAALDRIGGGRAESVVVAPFDGVVVSVAVAEGDRLAAGAPVLQFGHVDVLRVLLGIEPAERAMVGVGTRVALVPLVGISATTMPVLAEISEIQDIVDPKSLLLPALVVLRPTPGLGLVPGMKVRATLEAGSVRAIAVPRDAVLVDEKGAYLFQVAGNKALRTNVSQGLQSGDLVAVDGVADPSLPVVVVGNYELEDGMAVRVIAP